MFALPAGILASGFAEEIRKRDFVVTWTLVSQVPFFSRLVAPRIAEITQHLRPRIVEPGETIVRRGEPAESMYFIASGEVEVALHPHPIRLKGGQFFGEMALLGKARRSATVVAVTECRLLELESEDFEELMESDAELRETIARTAHERAEELEHHRREHAKSHGHATSAEDPEPAQAAEHRRHRHKDKPRT
ncbi:MAG: cyclic nucleotide-binding domain-containing protein [Alphaproteobacteria bacterium]